MAKNDRIITGIKIGVAAFGIALATITPFIPDQRVRIALTWTIALGVSLLWWAAGRLSGQRELRLRVGKLEKELAEAKAQTQAHIKYVRSLENTDYDFKNLLEGLEKGTITEVRMLARTAFRLLGGSEHEYAHQRDAFDEHQKERQEYVKRALKGGGEIDLVIQNPNIGIPDFTPEGNDLLRNQGLLAIRSFETISGELGQDAGTKGRLTLRITDAVVRNSMTYVTYDKRRPDLVVDLSMNFAYDPDEEGQRGAKRKREKPSLIFIGAGDEATKFRDQFDTIRKDAVPLREFQRHLTVGLEEVNRHVKDHSDFHSKLRQDQSERLAFTAAEYFCSETRSHRRLPPVCVQYLVTNRCTTTCAMCDHHILGDANAELDTTKAKKLLKSIWDIGTRAVVISGGEPLARDDLADILEYGHKCGLRLGLITNGVRNRGESINESLAGTIATTCSWIQMSIDSFDRQTYKNIRDVDCLNVARTSLKRVDAARGKPGDDISLQNVEVCYTVQKENIDQLEADVAAMDQKLPRDITVRLKIAHGPENGKAFLLSEGNVGDLNRVLKTISDNPRFNAKYLQVMIDNYFFKDGLAQGVPLQNRMRADFTRGKYLCHIMRLSCLIDADGTMYPCCFLFDDNHANSEIRPYYRVVPADEKDDALDLDVLKARWYDNPFLNGWRQQRLPIHMKACLYCTRYFYQNELLNEVYNVFSKYQKYGVAEEFLEQHENTHGIKDPYWL